MESLYLPDQEWKIESDRKRIEKLIGRRVKVEKREEVINGRKMIRVKWIF